MNDSAVQIYWKQVLDGFFMYNDQFKAALLVLPLYEHVLKCGVWRTLESNVSDPNRPFNREVL